MICLGALKNVICVLSGGPTFVVTKLVAVPSRELLGQARAPSMRTSVFDALQRARAFVSIFVPGWKRNWMLVWRFGLPAGSPGSLQVMKVSMPPDLAGLAGRYVISKVDENWGLAKAAAPATKAAQPHSAQTHHSRMPQT
jgi:hypothetical protein